MIEEILLLAVTRMLAGFCIAGVRLSDKTWVRPVKDYGVIALGDITYADRQKMAIGDVVAMNLLKKRAQLPHVEDWTCDFVRNRPRLVRRLEEGERSAFLAACCEKSPVEVLREQNRSLGLFRPDTLRASFQHDRLSRKLEARVWFPGSPDGRGIPCTDLKWRALGHRLIENRPGSITLEGKSLMEKIGLNEIYLAVGLTRSHEGRHWPLVIGVHTVPGYKAIVDYRNP